jgi:hypothetical protein
LGIKINFSFIFQAVVALFALVALAFAEEKKEEQLETAEGRLYGGYGKIWQLN